MKKKNGSGHQERRKKTNAQIRADNHRREIQMASKKKEETPPKWDDLNGVYQNCLGLLVTPAQSAQILSNRELLLSMGPNVKKLTELTVSLTNYIKEYKSKLDAIQVKHAGKTGVIDDGGELIDMFNIGQEYQTWTDSFNTVVIALVGDITSLAERYSKPTETETVNNGNG